MNETQPFFAILFFDGNCAVCSTLVQYILKIEKNSKLKFAPLQGETAARLLPKNLTLDLNTVVFMENNSMSTKSQAILNCLNLVRPSLLWSLLKWVPLFIRDALYTIFASHRHRFLKNNLCFIPSAQQKMRFLP